MCGGIKDENGNWNTKPHKDRIVWITDKELQVLSDTFEDGTTRDCAKLVSIHSNEIINILKCISSYPTRVKDYEYIANNCFHETGAVDNGIIMRKTCVPKIEEYEMIYNGPAFYVGNPLYKTPRTQCLLNSDYDNIDLTKRQDFVQRTNYVPLLDKDNYRETIQGFIVGHNENNKPIYDNFIDYYKVTLRCMLSQAGERTLICAVLPRKTAHIHAVISIAFRNGYDCVDMAALFSSIPYDFFTKTIGIGQIGKDMLSKYPMAVDNKNTLLPLRSRILLLNCLTTYYKDLWQNCWQAEYTEELWSINDPRLKPFKGLTEQWTWNTPLRNYFERRQALVEIDVLAAMALGLSLKDLELMYTIQFPVLQQNENDTWYDQKGNIVFTCSKGLTGVGCDRKEWESIRGEQLDDNTYAGVEPTAVHIIDPKKSELYGGEQVTYYAPYTRCDRIADYRRAWEHFEKRFKNKD